MQFLFLMLGMLYGMVREAMGGKESRKEGEGDGSG